MTNLRETKKKKEIREQIYIGIRENELKNIFMLPKICDCNDTQYVLKAQISEEYYYHGVVVSQIKVKCLHCGTVKVVKPLGDDAIILKDQYDPF